MEPEASLHVLHAKGNGYQLYMHYHPEIELTLILKGRGMRFVGDSVQPFGDGDLCLVGPNLLHSWYTGETPQETEAVVIQFRPETFAQVSRSWPEVRKLQRLAGLCTRGLAIPGGPGPIAGLILQTAHAPANSVRRLSWFLQAAEAICEVAEGQPLSISPPAASLAPPHADPSLARFQHVIDALHAQMPAAPDQAEMAKLAKMTPAGFSRFFKRFVGRSYVDYVNAWRVGLACRQLMQTALSITQIAFDCGFENLSNFNRQFRKYKGMTPREYRARASGSGVGLRDLILPAR
jgi:AraC-like DNA-binding protein